MTSLRAQFVRELTVRGRAQRTIHSYVARVAAISKYYKRSPDQLSDEEIRTWLDYLRAEQKLSGSSLDVAVQAIRAFQKWVLGRERERCVRGVHTCKRETVRAEVYARSEITKLLAAAPEGRDRALLSLLYACGMRRDEARLLKTGDLDNERGQLRVRRGKGAKERVLPLPAHRFAALRLYWKNERARRPGHDSPWLFQGARPGEPMSKALLLHLYGRAVQRAGIKRKGGLHTLRHSFATHLLEAGVKITVVQRLPGHTSRSTTARYLHVNHGRVQALALPLDPIGSLSRWTAFSVRSCAALCKRSRGRSVPTTAARSGRSRAAAPVNSVTCSTFARTVATPNTCPKAAATGTVRSAMGGSPGPGWIPNSMLFWIRSTSTWSALCRMFFYPCVSPRPARSMPCFLMRAPGCFCDSEVNGWEARSASPWSFPWRPSCAVSFCTSCPRRLPRSATTACSPTACARGGSHWPARLSPPPGADALPAKPSTSPKTTPRRLRGAAIATVANRSASRSSPPPPDDPLPPWPTHHPLPRSTLIRSFVPLLSSSSCSAGVVTDRALAEPRLLATTSPFPLRFSFVYSRFDHSRPCFTPAFAANSLFGLALRPRAHSPRELTFPL